MFIKMEYKYHTIKKKKWLNASPSSLHIFSLLTPSKDFLIFCNFTMESHMNHCLFIRLSEWFVFWTGTFFCLNIVLAYLACGCIKIKHCVLYIHDRDTTMIFDLNKVKFIGFFTSLCVQPITSLSYDIGISYLATGFITMSQCVIFRIPICC